MPELPDDDPRMEKFSYKLTELMGRFIGRSLDEGQINRIRILINDLRTSFKQEHGYDIPELVILILPTSRHLTLLRADLEPRAIHTALLNMLREFAVRRVPVNKLELAIAIKQAWPHYEPAIEILATDGQAKHAFIS